MDKIVNKTVDAMAKFGERLDRHLSTENSNNPYFQKSGSNLMFPSARSAFRRPLDKNHHKHSAHASHQQDLIYGGARGSSSDNVAVSPSYRNINNRRYNPRANSHSNAGYQRPYGIGNGRPLNYGNNSSYNYGSYTTGYPSSSSNIPHRFYPGNVEYAPNYYIAERRQIELVRAPPPRIVRERVPFPVLVDHPVLHPYPVSVPRPIPVDRPVPVPAPSPVSVDRPVPVPIPSPVPVDRPVPVPIPSPVPVDRPVLVPIPSPVPVDRPVPVPIPSPVPVVPPVPIPVPALSPPVCVPVPIASPVSCYIPVSVSVPSPIGVPVPSPVASPVMFEQSVSQTQRWIAGSPVMGINPYPFYAYVSFVG